MSVSWEGVRSQFVKPLGDGHDPKTIPQHYQEFYDQALALYGKFGHFNSVPEVPWNDWPLICLLADLNQKINKLEARLAEQETKPQAAVEPEPKVKHGPRRQPAVAAA